MSGEAAVGQERHGDPNLTAYELPFLLGAAYTRFYMRPFCLVTSCRVEGALVRQVVDRPAERVSARQARRESAIMSKAVPC